MSVGSQCPWCRKPVQREDFECPHCGFKLRDRPRALRGDSVDLIPLPSPWQRLRDRLRASPWARWYIVVPAAVLLGSTTAWYATTYPVRHELARVRDELEGRPELEKVSVAIPWFRRTLPERVAVTAVGLPGGYPAEVHVPLEGSYAPGTRKATLAGSSQIMFPYTKVDLKYDLDVPARNP